MSANDPVQAFFDRYGLANTSGAKHERRRAALTEARDCYDAGLIAMGDWQTEWEMQKRYSDYVLAAFRHYVQRNHEPSNGCSVCCDIEELIGVQP